MPIATTRVAKRVPLTEHELKVFVRRFNLTYTAGDYVLYRTDRGQIETLLELPAIVLGGRAVAMFRELDGYQSIEDNRVRHVPHAPAA
jgi:hypothetical protein